MISLPALQISTHSSSASEVYIVSDIVQTIGMLFGVKDHLSDPFPFYRINIFKWNRQHQTLDAL